MGTVILNPSVCAPKNKEEKELLWRLLPCRWILLQVVGFIIVESSQKACLIKKQVQAILPTCFKNALFTCLCKWEIFSTNWVFSICSLEFSSWTLECLLSKSLCSDWSNWLFWSTAWLTCCRWSTYCQRFQLAVRNISAWRLNYIDFWDNILHGFVWQEE